MTSIYVRCRCPMIPADPRQFGRLRPPATGHLPRTRQRWAAAPLCNEPSECWRPWPTPCPPASRSPTAEFWGFLGNSGQVLRIQALVNDQRSISQNAGNWSMQPIIYRSILSYQNILKSPKQSQTCGNPSLYFKERGLPRGGFLTFVNHEVSMPKSCARKIHPIIPEFDW